MNKNMKFLLIFVGCILVYAFLICFVFNKSLLDTVSPKYIVSKDFVWKVSGDEISDYRDSDYLKLKYNIYFNDGVKYGSVLRNGYVKVNDEILNNYVLASNINGFKVLNFDKDDVSIYSNAFLQDAAYGFSSDYYQYFNSYLIQIDLNNDNKKEDVYVISNISSMGNLPGRSLIFMTDGDKVLDTFVNDGKYKYDVSYIVDFDGDKRYEIIVSKESLDGNKCFQLYKFLNGKYVLKHDCTI